MEEESYIWKGFEPNFKGGVKYWRFKTEGGLRVKASAGTTVQLRDKTHVRLVKGLVDGNILTNILQPVSSLPPEERPLPVHESNLVDIPELLQTWKARLVSLKEVDRLIFVFKYEDIQKGIVANPAGMEDVFLIRSRVNRDGEREDVPKKLFKSFPCEYKKYGRMTEGESSARAVFRFKAELGQEINTALNKSPGHQGKDFCRNYGSVPGNNIVGVAYFLDHLLRRCPALEKKIRTMPLMIRSRKGTQPHGECERIPAKVCRYAGVKQIHVQCNSDESMTALTHILGSCCFIGRRVPPPKNGEALPLAEESECSVIRPAFATENDPRCKFVAVGCGHQGVCIITDEEFRTKLRLRFCGVVVRDDEALSKKKAKRQRLCPDEEGAPVDKATKQATARYAASRPVRVTVKENDEFLTRGCMWSVKSVGALKVRAVAVEVPAGCDIEPMKAEEFDRTLVAELVEEYKRVVLLQG